MITWHCHVSSDVNSDDVALTTWQFHISNGGVIDEAAVTRGTATLSLLTWQ